MSDELLDLKIVRIDRVYSNLPVATIRQWIAERRVTPDDLVRPVGAQNWLRIALAPEFAPPPPAPFPPPAAAAPRATQASPVVPAPAQRKANVPGGIPSGATTKDLSADDLATDLGISEPARSRPRRKSAVPEDTVLDMTPMIDVTFQLLIFFMLANQLANPAPVEVPTAKYGKGVMPDGKQSILMDEAGRYYLGQSATAESAEPSLDAVIRQVSENATNNDQPLEVIINAHKRSHYQYVRELLERLEKVDHLGVVHLGVEEKQ
jgi:biopolymer transport protein ExbD